MLRNDGDMTVTDITRESGLDMNNTRFSLAAAWEDYDNDGDADLYVANDFGRNNLYRNEGGKFTDVAAEAGVEDGAFGMAVSWGDYNHDGLMDIYVANMFSAAGNRVTYQRRFKPQATGEAKSRLQHTARGNTLFENRGDGTFRDVSGDAGAPWAAGVGPRCWRTLTTIAGKTWCCPTVTLPAAIRTTCEVSSGDRSCRTHLRIPPICTWRRILNQTSGKTWNAWGK